jgi:peptide deformylase
MKPLIILTRGNPSLSVPSENVTFPDSELETQLKQLHATLAEFRARNGFGRAMAAPQVGIMKRMIVMNLGATPFALINPIITWRSDDTFEVWDDCLSVPDCVVRVERNKHISVRYQDEQGSERYWKNLSPDLSELLQHEMDHLDGILMNERAVGDDAIRPISEHAKLVGAARPQHRLSLMNIAQSAKVIPSEFLNSPQYNCEPLSAALGCRLTIKLDFTNPIRSFKGRGASYFVSEFIRRGDTRTIVCASAGNWGQAMAYACRSYGLPIVIYAAVNANPLKVARMKALGAEVRQEGADFDAAKDAAKSYAKQINGWMVEDGLEVEVSEGHGTIAMELLALGDAFDIVTIPLGNGAMLNGMARWLKAASPASRVWGVSAVGADAMEKSWRDYANTNTIITPSYANTIADGIAVRVPIPEAVDDMQGLVDDVLLVDDAHIIQAMRLVYQHAGLLLEPAGAVGVAAIVAHREQFEGKQVATVLCGSNITESQIKQYLF